MDNLLFEQSELEVKQEIVERDTKNVWSVTF